MPVEIGPDGVVRLIAGRRFAEGSEPGLAVEGDDPRLSDDRDPLPHGSTHEDGGTDEITPIPHADRHEAGGFDPLDLAVIAGLLDLGQTPLTTKGDILIADADSLERLPVGSNGDILVADSSQASGLRWDHPQDGAVFLDVVKQAADLTRGTADLGNTDLVFSYEASSVYLIDLFLLCSSAATTTGYRFAWDTSTAITTAALAFQHVLANTGTVTAGDAIADDTARGLSSGVAGANVVVPLIAQGILVTAIAAGTCRLRFGPEVAANATLKANSTMRVMKVA